ncbi:MAG: FtsX-like permease family protein [Anaerolineales bacterium]|jgi:ABC-type antimicrobial peptide transport system permease subunit
MKTNVSFLSSLRQPFRSLLVLILLGLISFAFVTKAVGYVLVQSQTGVLGSYYRSIGVLVNSKDPQSGDVSAGIDLIKTSPYFAYGDQRQLFSGVMPQTYNENFQFSNNAVYTDAFPKEQWPNTHNTDIWFTGVLIKMEQVTTFAKPPANGTPVGCYYLEFNIDTLFAGYPEYAQPGQSISFLFLFQGNESAIPIIQEMEVGQRYFIRGWENVGSDVDISWMTHGASLQIKPLDDGQLWYMPLNKGASIDFSTPEMASIKNQIDVLNENLHTLGIIATADMSAMPTTQEASRYYYLAEGRWLNHQDDLAGNKVIVVPEEFANLRGLRLGDEIDLTFRPLTDTFYGLIRDGVDSLNWRSYPTYQDTFKIVGLYNTVKSGGGIYAYIPSSSLRPGFASTTQNKFRDEEGYSFVLDSSRHETQFTQEYKVPLQALGINLTFLANNGTAYWAAVDPIRRSSSADLLVFGLLMVVALTLAVFLYVMARKREYAILRALGVPAKQANQQTVWPLLLLGGLGISLGGLSSWNYAIDQAKASLSTLPMPSGVSPSADLSLFVLAGLCAAVFLLLALFTWLGVLFLSSRPVFELLQGGPSGTKPGQTRARISALSQPIPASSSSPISGVDHAENSRQGHPVNKVDLASQRKYNPSSLSRYVRQHALRSRLKSFLTLAVALGFMLASGWIRQTMERSRLEVDRLYDTTVVTADIVQANPSILPPAGTLIAGSGFVYRKTIDSVLNSGFVKSSELEADTWWNGIGKLDAQIVSNGPFPVYAYDSPDAFHSGLADPASLVFASGWNMKLFAEPRTLQQIQVDGVPALFPVSRLEQLQLNVGERVQIHDPAGFTYNCVIVGQYSGGIASTVNSITTELKNSAGDYILISLSALESMQGSQTKFTVAHFVLDPKKNRELPQFRADMEKPIGIYGGNVRLIVWDEQLSSVIAPLEKNLSLLEVLYPVVIAVSILIAAGLCFLLLLQTTREAAILRVLGTTKTAVRLALILEPLFLSIIGVIIGLGISGLLWMASGLVTVGPLLTSAGLYLAGVLVGSVIGTISVTNKKPIELLQVKE